MKTTVILFSVFVSSCTTKEASLVSNGTQKYISQPSLIGCEGYRYYSPMIGRKNNRYIWTTKILNVYNRSNKFEDLWMFKLSFLSDGKRFSIPYKSTKNIAIKYTIANNLDAKIIFLDSKLSEWCRSESPDVAGGAIYWPDFLQNKRLQREFKSIKFDLDPNKEYNITFEVDGTQCTNFQKDAKCRVELGFGGFL